MVLVKSWQKLRKKMSDLKNFAIEHLLSQRSRIKSSTSYRKKMNSLKKRTKRNNLKNK